MITPKDVERKSMTEAKRQEAKNSIIAFYVGRPISYVFTIPFLYANISPNVVTVLSIICIIASWGFLSFAQSIGMRLIGLAFVVAWNLGDGIDGNIARYRNIKSENGDLLDTLGGYLATVFIILSVGNAAYFDTFGHVFISPVVPVMLGGVSAISTIVPRALIHRKLAKQFNSYNETKDNIANNKMLKIVKIIVINLCDPAGGQEILVLLAIIFHLCTEFTICFCFLNVAIMMYSIYSMLDNSKKEK